MSFLLPNLAATVARVVTKTFHELIIIQYARANSVEICMRRRARSAKSTVQGEVSPTRSISRRKNFVVLSGSGGEGLGAAYAWYAC